MFVLIKSKQSKQLVSQRRPYEWLIIVILSAICFETNTASKYRKLPSHYYPRGRGLHPSTTTTTTTLTRPENPLPPVGELDEIESLPSTTSSAPANTLHSPFHDTYIPVTPSISPSTRTSGKVVVRPRSLRAHQKNQQIITRRFPRPHPSFSANKGGRIGSEEGGWMKWPLQPLDEDNALGVTLENDKSVWWVTNEPQLTLAAPETTISQRLLRRNFQQLPRSTRILNWGVQESETRFHNPLDMISWEAITRKPARTTSRASRPTIRMPFPAPTTLAEDPAVLQAPQELITSNEIRQPRWFPLDRLFRMITVGTNRNCVGRNGRTGICMLESACRDSGGLPSTSCTYGYGSCCIEYKASCGLDIRTNRTYWVSPLPGKDPVVTTGGSCFLRIYKTSPDICHIRLDMRTFTLLGPQDGSCLRDRLVVSGHNINSFIPKICGENSGQHMYIDVDTVSGPIELNVNTVGEGLERSWEIQVSQIACNSQQRPPANCLQYYMGAQGSFSSFNYQSNLQSQYLNNLNYAICLRKEAGFCSVVYNNAVTGATSKEFEIVNFKIGPTGLATSVIPVGEAGIGLIKCPDDYLVMAGTRLCGDRFNDGSSEPQPTNNGPVTDSTNGPFTVQFVSNTQYTGQGFNLQYQQYPC